MDNATEEKKKGRLAEIAAYMATTAASLYAAWVKARALFFKEFKAAGELQDAAVHENVRLKDFKAKALTGNAYSVEFLNIRKKYKEECAEIIREKGFTNAFAKFKHLEKNDKFSTGLTFLTVFSIGVGIITSIKGNRKMENKLDQIEKRLNIDNEGTEENPIKGL